MLPAVPSLAGSGATLIGIAFGVHPVQAANWIFWALLLVGVCAVAAAGGVLLMRSLPTKTRLRRAAAALHLAVAALDALIDERGRERPRAILLVGNTERVDRWHAETAERYRDTIRAWIRPIFAEAVAYGAISRTVRPLVEAPHGGQLELLRDRLREAAERLERRVA